jgi:hypothetical protein
MPRDPESRRMAASLGGLQLHATHNSTEVTQSARLAFKARFFDQTDPDLPLAERLKRADYLLRAHMTRLAMKSLTARRKKATQRQPWKHLDGLDASPGDAA